MLIYTYKLSKVTTIHSCAMSNKTGLLLICILGSVFLVAVTLAVPHDDGEEGQSVDLHQWVVSVPQGLERAKRLSEEHDLNFLGEVIPDTNLYHVSVREHHRRRRSVIENVHQSLTGHPGYSSAKL